MANHQNQTPVTAADAIPVSAMSVSAPSVSATSVKAAAGGESQRRRRRAVPWAGLIAAAAAVAGSPNGSLRADDLGRLLDDRPAPSAKNPLKNPLIPPLKNPLPGTPAPAEAPPGRAADGEDLGARGESDIRLKAIERTMAQVTEGLLASKTGEETQRLQLDALRELDALIADLESSTQSSRPGAARAGAASGDGGGASESQGRPTAGGQGGDNGGAAAPPGLRKIWGHLPLRVRDRMRGAAVERFLPGYELLIEEYYKRLAEPQGFGP